MASISFEQLPDELLLTVCSYLTCFDVLKSFNDLNSRFNRTIQSYRQNLDLRSLSLRQFYSYSRWIRTSFGVQVRSLTLSNAVPSVRQLVLFRRQIDPFERILLNLERLVLIDHYDDELDLYLPLINQLKHLKELKINFVKNRNESTLSTFLSQMLSNNFVIFDQSAKRRKTNPIQLERLSLTGTGFLKLTPFYNETIRHLTIEIENLDDLLEIFLGFESLRDLHVNIKQFPVLLSNYEQYFTDQQKIQCSSLTEFHLQSFCQLDRLDFQQFVSVLRLIPNLEKYSCTLKSDVSQDKLRQSDLLNVDLWRQFCESHRNLVHLDCLIKCLVKSSNSLEMDFLRITAERSRSLDRSVDIRVLYRDDFNCSIKTDVKDSDKSIDENCLTLFVQRFQVQTTFELDLQELHRTSGRQLAKKLSNSEELTLYSDVALEDEKFLSNYPDSLLLPERRFVRLRSLDLLGEFPNMNNPFLVTFVKQLLCRSPNLQSIGFFLYWVENMTDLVLTFLRPLRIFLKQIKKCYLYTEGDIDQKFISELAQLLPSLTLLSVKIDWYCNTAEVVNLCLIHMKHLIHLEIVVEEIPDYLDEDCVDKMKMEKEIESLAMSRDTREWLKRNTLLGKRSNNKLFRAEKNGNDLKIWL